MDFHRHQDPAQLCGSADVPRRSMYQDHLLPQQYLWRHQVLPTQTIPGQVPQAFPESAQELPRPTPRASRGPDQVLPGQVPQILPGVAPQVLPGPATHSLLGPTSQVPVPRVDGQGHGSPGSLSFLQNVHFKNPQYQASDFCKLGTFSNSDKIDPKNLSLAHFAEASGID